MDFRDNLFITYESHGRLNHAEDQLFPFIVYLRKFFTLSGNKQYVVLKFTVCQGINDIYGNKLG